VTTDHSSQRPRRSEPRRVDHESGRPAALAPTGLVRRVTLLVWLVLGGLVAQAPPASAHSADQSPASNFTTRVVPLTDAQREAFDFEVIEATNRVELEWRSGPPITVSDYDDRPYLRIGRAHPVDSVVVPARQRGVRDA
jgi:hypothetical protein